MLNRLSRILLALVTAFVFSGQMEAAAEHCARLAHEAQSSAPAEEAAPCHESADAVMLSHSQHGGHAAPAHDRPNAPAPDHCECVAALNGWTAFAGPRASTIVAPYAWLPPEAEQVASSKPDPDFRPPRA
jgi:hypothetical protein